jgi:ATP-dependent Clp protease ATP-binding subunit ClpA
MARLIQERIKRPLAEELLFGRLARGGRVGVGVELDGAGLSFAIEGAEEAVPSS